MWYKLHKTLITKYDTEINKNKYMKLLIINKIQLNTTLKKPTASPLSSVAAKAKSGFNFLQ